MAKKVLVCDDDEGILDVVAMILDNSGYSVIKQLHSINVMEDVKNHQPELIILDLWMPYISGDALTKQLKQNSDTRHIPILIISASPDGRAIANQVYADGFIAKPFDLSDLVNKVNRYICHS